MKFALRLLNLMLIFSFVMACKKKAEEETPTPTPVPTTPVANSTITLSTKTATGVTLTWVDATDDATPAASLQYKVVYSTTDNLTTAATAQTNGTLSMDWTAATLTKAVTGLSNSTLYYFAVLVKDVDGNVGLANTSTTTLCTGKRIFLATASDGNLGGKAGADAICAAQKPAGMVSVKAMISDNNGINTTTGLPGNANGRQACYGDCRSANLYVLDWVFTAGQRYCTTDYVTKVGDAGATYPVLNVTTANVLSTTPVTLFAGFHIYFGNSTTNCSNWTTTAGTYVGGITSGTFTTGSNSFITGSNFPSCASAASLVCVEQ